MDGSVVAVVGRNGRGKSHLLGAIHFALTGDLPGQARRDVPTWDSDGPSYAELTFEHKERVYDVRRRVDANEVTLRSGDVKLASGAKNVAAALKTLCGVDADLCRQAVFVRQKDIDSVLFDDPAEREQAWQRLVGVKDAAKVHAELGRAVAAARPPPVDVKGALARLGEALSRRRARRAALAENEAARARIGSSGLFRDPSDLLLKLHAAGVAKARLDKAGAELDLMVKMTPEGAPDAPTIERAMQAVADATRKMEADAAVRRAVDLATRSVELAAQVDPAVEPAHNACAAAAAEARADVLRLEKLVAAAGKSADGVCDLCGSEIKDAAARLAALKSELAKARAESAKLGDESAKLGALRRKSEQAAMQSMLLNDQAQAVGVPAMKARNELAGAPALDEAQAMVAKARKAREAQDHLAKLAGCRGAVDSARAFHAAQNELWTAAAADFGVVCASQVQPMIDAFNAAKSAMAVAAAAVGTARAELSASATDAKARALDALAARNARRTAVKTLAASEALGRVRDWFHYANGPRAVSARAMELVGDGVNRFLDAMGAAFTVKPDQDKLEFLVSFSDGRSAEPVAASELSGGERVVLAVCFRLSAYCAFAGRLGVLSLDEPTVYLDDDNVAGFCRLLENLRKISAGMSVQVFMATHERSVADTADVVVSL